MDASRVIRRLRELDDRSGGARVAWTDTWASERERFLDELRAEVPGLEVERDEAGNVWARLPGSGPGAVAVGSHLDSVPGGGWLDGCLGVLAGAEALRAAAALPGARRRSLVLVAWADEEGARFGHSLLGSSAAAGMLDAEAAARLVDAEGVTLRDALAAHGVDVFRMHEARSRLEGLDAMVELHIEQGPVLDEEQAPVAAVDGCLGVRRRGVVFSGQAAHAGATPMRLRRDPVVAAARFALELRELAAEAGGLGTIGSLRAEPGTATAVPERVRLTIDLRHRELGALEELAGAVAAAAREAAAETGCEVSESEIWRIDPIRFDPSLVARATELCGGRVLTSGPLHDAAAVARAGVPTVMIFARTLGGLSHTREEDAREEDLVVALEAFGALVAELVRGEGAPARSAGRP